MEKTGFYAYETAQSYKCKILSKLRMELDACDEAYDTASCAGLLSAINLIKDTEIDSYPVYEVKQGGEK